MSGAAEQEQLVKVSWLYYFGNLTQQEIAKKLDLSRPKVGRLLKSALETGIIEIRIAPTVESAHLALAYELETCFGLKEALVVDTGENKEALYYNMGQAGARFLARALTDETKLGIAMGTSIAAIMPHVQPGRLKAHTVVTLSGGFSQPGHDTSVYNISWALADALGANLEQLYCPLVAQSSAARDMIVNDPNTQAQIKSAAECDIALVSVGVVNKDMPLHRQGFCEAEDIENLQRAGAAGEMIVSFFDGQGRPIVTDLSKRMIGLTIDDLHNIPTMVAISGGPEKVEALLGALRAGCIDVMITDRETAEAILELDEQYSPS